MQEHSQQQPDVVQQYLALARYRFLHGTGNIAGDYQLVFKAKTFQTRYTIIDSLVKDIHQIGGEAGLNGFDLPVSGQKPERELF